jgi:branched-chain amino acid transport system substrate-binding protein
MRKGLISILTITSLLITVPGFSVDKTITIGGTISYSGVMALYGKMGQRGYEFYKDFVNAQGGIEVGGEKYKLDIKYYDDMSDAATSAKMVEKFIIDDNIKFLLMPVGSGPAFAATSVAEKFRLPMIGSLASSDKIYERGYKYIFGLLALGSTQWQSMYELVLTLNPRPRTVAIMCRNDLFPLTSAKGSKELAEKAGLKVVMFEPYPAGTQDMSPMLNKAKFLHPDIFHATGHIGEAIQIAKQLRELGLYFPIVMLNAGPESAEFVDSVKDGGEDIIGASNWVSSLPFKGPVLGPSSDYANEFKKKYGYLPSYVEASSTNALLLYHLAFQKAGSLEPQKVRDAITALNLNTFFGPVRFDERGENVGAVCFPIQIQKGNMVPIYPKSYATGTIVYPHPKWKK